MLVRSGRNHATDRQRLPRCESASVRFGAIAERGGELLHEPPPGPVDQLVPNRHAIALSAHDSSFMQDGKLLGNSLLAHRDAGRERTHRGTAPFVQDLDQANSGRIAERSQHRGDHLDHLGRKRCVPCGSLMYGTLDHLTTKGRKGLIWTPLSSRDRSYVKQTPLRINGDLGIPVKKCRRKNSKLLFGPQLSASVDEAGRFP